MEPYEPTIEEDKWLTEAEAGFVGLSKPQVVRAEMTAIERLQVIQGDWPDRDNWAGDPEQAWA